MSSENIKTALGSFFVERAFYGKKRKNGEGNLFSRNNIWCVAANYKSQSYGPPMSKMIFRFELQLSNYRQNQICTKLPQILHNIQKTLVLRITGTS